MPENDSSLEDRVAELSREVRSLGDKLETLATRVDSLASERPPSQEDWDEPEEAGLSFGELTSRAGMPSLLSSVSAVSFILVIALILRTIMDQGVVDPQIGSLLGIAYAVLLISVGYRRYSQGHPLAPTYVTCAALLMFAIVFETRLRGFVPVPISYSALGLTLLVAITLGVRHGVAIPLWVGVLGSSLTATLLEFPNPHFPSLALFLWVANASAYAGSRVSIWLGLRWTLFGITLFFWQLWTLKLRAPLLRGEAPSDEWSPEWFFPALAAFFIVYVGMVARALAGRRRTLKSFEKIIPIANVLWVYAVGFLVATPWTGDSRRFAQVAAAAAIVHLLFAVWIARLGAKGRQGAVSFSVAGVVLLMLSLDSAVGSTLLSLPAWSILALVLTYLSVRWNNRSVRVLGCGVQAFVCVYAFWRGAFAVAPELDGAVLAVALIVAASGLSHYYWLRKKSLVPDNGLFASIDPTDRIGIVPLAVSMVTAFAAIRLILYVSFPVASGETVAAFQCGQTVVITGTAAVLLLLALRWRNGELLAMAFAITLIGALKVFIGDATSIKGVPLVLGVLSFAINASIGSLVWGRWQRLKTADETTEEEPPGAS